MRSTWESLSDGTRKGNPAGTDEDDATAPSPEEPDNLQQGQMAQGLPPTSLRLFVPNKRDRYTESELSMGFRWSAGCNRYDYLHDPHDGRWYRWGSPWGRMWSRCDIVRDIEAFLAGEQRVSASLCNGVERLLRSHLTPPALLNSSSALWDEDLMVAALPDGRVWDFRAGPSMGEERAERPEDYVRARLAAHPDFLGSALGKPRVRLLRRGRRAGQLGAGSLRISARRREPRADSPRLRRAD